MLNRYQRDDEVKPLDWQHVNPWFVIPISLQIFQSWWYSCDGRPECVQCVGTSSLSRLTERLIWFCCSCPVLASNLLILTQRRENIDKLFLVNSYLPGCCIIKIASRWRHLSVLCTGVWKLSTAVQCCQHVDKLLQVNDDVFVAKGYEHMWASSGHRLKWAFCGCRTDVEVRAYVRTASYAPANLSGTTIWTARRCNLVSANHSQKFKLLMAIYKIKIISINKIQIKLRQTTHWIDFKTIKWKNSF